MAIIEQITQMKHQNIPAGQIIQLLKEQGYSPKEINEALSQSEIKAEVDKFPQNISQVDQQEINTQDSFQPSIYGKQETVPAPSPEQFSQQLPEQVMEYPQTDYQYHYQEQSQYPEYTMPQSFDFESITDLTSQIIDEKIQQIRKEISSFIKFKKQMQEEFKSLKNKVDRIESTINELQLAIIKKVGEYGENIKNISDELRATQDSFSKIINPLTDRVKDIQKEKAQKLEEKNVSEEKESDKPKKSKDGFESYLR